MISSSSRKPRTRGITVSDAELDKGLQKAFGFFANGTPTTAPTGTPFVTATYSPTQLTWVPPTADPHRHRHADPGHPDRHPHPATADRPTVNPRRTHPHPAADRNALPHLHTVYTLEGYQNHLCTISSLTAEAVGY